jgi:hypothetical protein
MNKELETRAFEVPVVRIGYGFTTIVVMAKTLEEAEELALDEAGDHEYSEKSSEYEIEGESKPKLSTEDLEKIYHEIDGECISETENVSMTTIRKIFAKYGAETEKMF